ncbi:TVP38/TMEM64 family protein [Chitinophaga agrisoli]|uniref:TVP38/TMEM64 family membrane protein n=1 Tax=Chitinophaga agrisoli TaxID=2607653 RepID=A0A5B2VWV5_9BACT|nr:VTT domain-containing protein [Chitinophaga agrisoli]KAA2243575.1 TVP38/TMEM64 family protein [Chitinophaga agrisoli]
MQAKHPLSKKSPKPSKLPLFVSIGLLVALAICYWQIPGFRHALQDAWRMLTNDNEKEFRQWISQFGFAGPVILVLVMVVQMFLFVIPNVLVMMIAINGYGPFWGSVISFVGVFASSSTGYMIGRYLSPSTVSRFVSEKNQHKISSFIKDYGVAAIAITRLSSLSNDSLGFVTGLLKMDYKKYILATMGGITPLIVLLAIYGKNGKIEKALIWVAAISLAGLIAYIIIDKRRKHKKKPLAEVG